MRLSLKKMSGCLLLAGLIAFSLFFAGCETTNAPGPSKPGGGTNQSPPISITISNTEVLRIGDKVRVELTGTPNAYLPQEQEVKEDGTIKIMNIGPVQAVGKTPAVLEEEIQIKLVPEYFTKATITITPLNTRSFYVGGEVVRPDRYPYLGTITLTRAIQAAGDFTLYADKKNITLSRPNAKPVIYNWKDLQKHPEKDPQILPGDSIIVAHRWI